MASRHWTLAGLALAATVWISLPAYADPGDTVISVMPVYSQLVAWHLPAGFHGVNEENHAGHYTFEAVRGGDTVNLWSQLISLTGEAGLTANPQLTPKLFATGIASGFKQTCPDAYHGVELEAPSVEGRETFAAVAGCGQVPGSMPARGEITLIVVIKGARDYYTVQWAERVPAQPGPPSIDVDMWSQRLADLLPIQVCDAVPGEKPPYPSCTSGMGTRPEAQSASAAAPRHDNAVDSDAVLARWEAAGFTLTLKHYLATLANTCDSLPGAPKVGGKGLLQVWQERARNGLFLDASQLYQTAFVAAVQKSNGEQAAQSLLARQMELVHQQGDAEALKLLVGNPTHKAETCRQAKADVTAGQYDIAPGSPYYATLDRLSQDLGADDGAPKGNAGSPTFR